MCANIVEYVVFFINIYTFAVILVKISVRRVGYKMNFIFISGAPPKFYRMKNFK